MRPVKKPGPKSKKRLGPQKKPPPADLGDTDTESSSPPNETFRSPPPDNNITDYNLDFTNDTVRRTPRQSPRRQPSTLLATTEKASTSRGFRKPTAENRPPVSSDSRPENRRRRKQPFPKRKEWIKLLSSINLMIPRAPFARIVRELMIQHSRDVCMITRDALEALQTASEKYIETRFEDAYLVTLHCGRKTLFVRDMELVNCLLSRFNMN